MVTAPENPALPSSKALVPQFVATHTPDEILDEFEAKARNTFYGAMAFPLFWPNFGPDMFAALLGAEMRYSEDSSETSWIDWSNPVLGDYGLLDSLAVSPESLFHRKLLDITRAAAQRGAGRYLVGITDLHAGFDALVALRGGPDRASLDLVDFPEGVTAAMGLLFKAWKQCYDEYLSMVAPTQKGTSSWMGLYGAGKTFPVQNDFSCLVSPVAYRRFFLDELLQEIEYLDASIYHLDGPEALQHLDVLLGIGRLNAIQWVAGARSRREEGIETWFPLYRKIQAAKKAIVVYPFPEEVPLVLKELSPEGLLLHVACATRDEAEKVMKAAGWPC